jgi:hypothetical protein
MKKYLEIDTKLGKRLVCIDTWMYLEYDANDPDTKVYVHLTGGTHRILITGNKLKTDTDGIIKYIQEAMEDAYASSWLKVSHPLVLPDVLIVNGTTIDELVMQLLP